MKFVNHSKLTQVRPGLNLVPLIDLFTVVLIFFLCTTTIGDGLQSEEEHQAVQLPYAMGDEQPLDSHTITIQEAHVLVNGRQVTGVSPEQREWQRFAAAFVDLPLNTKIVIQADRSLNFDYVERAAFELIKLKYHDIQLSVTQEKL